MFRWFELFLKWLLAKAAYSQSTDLGATITKIDRDYQIKSDLLDMQKAAMETALDDELAQIEREHKAKMAEIMADRHRITHGLETEKVEPKVIEKH